MDNSTSDVLEIIDRLSENDNIDHGHMIKVMEFLVDNKGVMTPNDLSKIVCDDEVFANVTGDTGWLDVEDDYDGYEKLYPVFSFGTKDGRPLTSPFGFLCYMLKSLGLDTPHESERKDLDDYIGDDCVTYTYKDYGWTWVEVGHTDPTWTVLYHTFGESLTGVPHPCYQYCDDTEETYG